MKELNFILKWWCNAGGLGSFEPRKPLIEVNFYENRESSISSKIQKI
jgi:hypothetical protein